MDMVRPIHFVPLDFVVFDPYSNHRKYCAPIQRHFYLEYLCIRDEHGCMEVDERSVVWLKPIQQMHSTFLCKTIENFPFNFRYCSLISTPEWNFTASN